MSLIRKAFKRLHYPGDVIAQCVRWYLAYALSLRDLEEMMAERGILVDHSTLYRWVIRLAPLLNKAFRRYKLAVDARWRMDETYIKVKGPWKYLYRAVDSSGQTIDFLLTAKRDAAAALHFFRKAIRQHGEPEVVTIDKSGANRAALAALNAGKSKDDAITVRQQKYLNNLVEQHQATYSTHVGIQVIPTSARDIGWYRGGSDDTQRAIPTSCRGRSVPCRAVLSDNCLKNSLSGLSRSLSLNATELE